jgi:hypothetical protein
VDVMPNALKRKVLGIKLRYIYVYLRCCYSVIVYNDIIYI